MLWRWSKTGCYFEMDEIGVCLKADYVEKKKKKMLNVCSQMKEQRTESEPQVEGLALDYLKTGSGSKQERRIRAGS